MGKSRAIDAGPLFAVGSVGDPAFHFSLNSLPPAPHHAELSRLDHV
jgi:hypothetical protein